MVSVNFGEKQIIYKVVYYGPALGGKTTNLKQIHTQLPESRRSRLITLATNEDRTLFFDFMPLDLGEIDGFKVKFQLYTVPGQTVYKATRKLVLQGVDGIVFVADAQRHCLSANCESLEDLQQNLLDYGYEPAQIPLVLQYNKQDLSELLGLDELEQTLNPKGYPYFCTVATQGKGVRETLRSIALRVIEHYRLAGKPAVVSDTPRALSSPPPVTVPPASKSPTPSTMAPPATTSASRIPSHLGAVLPVRQIFRLQWRGMRVASGIMELSAHDHRASSVLEFSLLGKYLGLCPFSYTAVLKCHGQQKIRVNDRQLLCWYLCDVEKKRCHLWLHQGLDRAIYGLLSMKTMHFTLAPYSGKKIKFIERL